MNRATGLFFFVLSLNLLLGPALQAADLEPATGGEALPPEGGGEFTELDGPVVTESDDGQVGEGQIVLELPADFEYETSNPPSMCLTDGHPGAQQNINQLDVGDCETAQPDPNDNARMIFDITQSSGQTPNQLTFENLNVRPVDGAENAEGDIFQTGSSNIDGLDDPDVSWGSLVQASPGDNVILTAQGETDEITVEVTEEVNFEVNAFNCDDASLWRDLWDFGDGTTDFDDSPSSPCNEPRDTSHTYESPGTYEVEFVSQSCELWVFLCLTGWEEFGRDTVTVIVEPIDIEGLLLSYWFDEDWADTGDEIPDRSNNDRTGIAEGVEFQDDLDEAARSGSPGTCGFVSTTGDDNIRAPAGDYINDNDDFTLSLWIRSDSDQDTDLPSIVSAGDLDGDRGERFELLLDDSGSAQEIEFAVRQDNQQQDSRAVRATVPDDEWIHVAVQHERQERELALYVNGSEAARDDYGGPRGLVETDDELQIGGFSDDPFRFSGDMDELRFFDQVLSEQEIVDLFEEERDCVGEVDRYVLSHTGSMVSCEAAEITVEAEDDGEDPINPEDGTTIELSSDQGGGFWATTTGPGDFSAGDDGAATYTFSGDESDVSFGYNYTDPGNDALSVVPTATDGDAGSVADPSELLVQRAGFRFLDRDTGEVLIPDQISGRPSDEPGDDLAIQAIRANDEEPEQCDGVYEEGETAVVEFGAECRDPEDCAGESMTVNGETVATSADNFDDGAPADYTPVTLEFEADSTAPVSLNYPDAGQTRLYTRAEIIRDDDEAAGDFILGSSNAFVWRPFGFHVDAPDDAGEAPDPDGSILATAGEDFSVNLRAVLWEPGQDEDGDGTPDADADLSGNATTPNFGNENDPVSASLQPEVAAPEAGEDGTLENASFENFSAGEDERDDVRWSEVGYADLLAESDSAYLGTESIEGTGQEIGRFIPDRYLASDTPGELGAFCTEESEFSYLTRPMPHDPSPVVTVEAVNAQGQRTRNAHDFRDDGGENWWRFDALSGYDSNNNNEDFVYADDGIPDEHEDDLAVDAGATGMADQITEDVDFGRSEVEFDGDLAHRWDHDTDDPAPSVIPFTSELQVEIRLRDQDDVEYEEGTGEGSAWYELALPVEDNAQQRHGRLELRNAHGSELIDLAVPTRTQYYQGSEDGWIRHRDDVCTDGITLALTERAGSIVADDTCAIEDGNESGIGCEDGDPDRNWTEPPEAPEGGDFNLWLRAPGEGNSGALELSVPGQPSHLNYDWSRDGEHDESDRAEITFGIFGGNPRQIDRREVR